MNKVEIIARRILGWKLNSWDKWYDFEKGIFIENFQPAENLEHSLLIVERMQQLGFAYIKKGDAMVCFNDVCAAGETLAEAITNAAYSIAENPSIDDAWL